MGGGARLARAALAQPRYGFCRGKGCWGIGSLSGGKFVQRQLLVIATNYDDLAKMVEALDRSRARVAP